MDRKRKGFTLIELMVVIAIIGVLSAAVMPNLNGLINKGKIAAAQAEMNTFKTVLAMWTDDNGSMPPGGGWCSWDFRGMNGALRPYLDKDIAQDPWKTNYFYGNARRGYGNMYVIISWGKDKVSNGTCGCRHCCWYYRGGVRTCGDDLPLRARGT